MKVITFALVSLFSVSAMAVRPTPLALSVSSSAGPIGLSVCGTPTGNIGDLGVVGCGAVFSTLNAVSTTVLVLLKEEVQHVEADAYNFLAGEEISLGLEEVMNTLRSESEELASKSNEELAAIMLEASVK